MGNSLSDYRFEVILEQITPYVNDIGCNQLNRRRDEIFRTTEFKPRFDKFLIERFNIEDGSSFLLPRKKEEENSSKNGEKKIKALNYKVMLEGIAGYKYEFRREYDEFKTSGNKYYARPEGAKFKLIFFSLNKALIGIIKEGLSEFLAITNFGKRQSKCYGSFYIAKEDKSYKDIDKIERLKEFRFFKEDWNYIEFEKEKREDIFKKLKNKAGIQLIVRGGRDRNYLLLRAKKKMKGLKNPSLAIMKLLKKDEKRYRLYIIPNFEVIRAWSKRIKRIEVYSKSDETFDCKKFEKYIKLLK